MRDLRSRWNSSVVLISFAILLICSAVEGGARVIPGSTALVANRPHLYFGTVAVGNDRVLAEYILNPTGDDVTITAAEVSSGDFQVTAPNLPLTIPAGRWARVEITFEPQASGASSGTIEFANTAPQSPLKISLSGNAFAAGQLVVNPASISFGSVPMGSSQNKPATVVNMGGTSVTVSQAASTVGDFTISGMNLPYTLQPNQSATFTVAFSPKANGNRSGNISLVGSTSGSRSRRFRNGSTGPTQTATIQVVGTGGQAPTGNTVGALTAAPGSVDFGTPASGSSQSKPVVLTNSGTTDITVSSAAVTGAAGYTVGGVSFPLTLPGGQSATLNVTFAPTSTGAANGTLTVASNASNPTLNVGVTATVPSPGSLVVNTNPVTFGTIPVGTSLKRTATITNSGGSSVMVNQAQVTGTGFTLGTLSTPMTLAAGQSANIDITCAPKSAGGLSGNLMVTSTATNPTLAVVLSGTAVTPGALTTTPSSFSFGSVQTGNTQTLPGSITNSGGTSVTVSQDSFTGGPYTLTGLSLPLTLAAGQSQSFTVAFAPKAAGTQNFNLSITSDAPNPTLTVPVSGTGVAPGALSASAPSLSFGNVLVNSSTTLPETLTNSGGSSVTVSQASFTGGPYTLTGLSLPLTLAAGQSQSFTVAFAPKAAGTQNFNLSITSDAPNPTLTVPVSGTGVAPGALSASAPSLSFGNVLVNGSTTLPETLTNSGGSSVIVSQASFTGGPYTLTGLSLPLTLAAGQSQSFTVAFAPKAAGAQNFNLSITSDAPNPTLTVPVSGSGVAPGALSASAPSLSFGNVLVNGSTTLPETLTNSGGSSVIVSQASFTGGPYTLTGLSLPLTLAAGQGQSFTVAFAPKAAGAQNFNLSITSNAPNPTLTVPVSGSGVTPGALSASAPSLSFGNVPVNASKTLPETLTNTGGTSVKLNQAAAGSGYSVSGLSLPLTLGPGQTTSFNVVFAPTASGNASVSLAIANDSPSSTFSIPLSGTGTSSGALTVSAVSFGNVQVGNNSTLPATIKNSGGSPVNISGATLTGTGFTMSGLTTNPPLTLAAGQTFTFNVTFTPASAAAASGSIALVSDAVSSPSITLSGTGTAVGQFSVTPGTLAFGSVIVGSNKSMTGTLGATGSSVTVTSASVNSPEFVLSGISLPLTIKAGATAPFTMMFTPQSSGGATATVSFLTSASTTAFTESLTGTGTAAPQHSVDLSWNPSASTVNGYNVYRGSKTGGPYSKINPSLDGTTTYADGSVQAGQTYFYVTTAVATDGTESTFSNEVNAVIPTP